MCSSSSDLMQALKKRLSGADTDSKSPNTDRDREAKTDHIEVNFNDENGSGSDSLSSGHITTKQLEQLGTQTKTGYMSFQKTNGLITRWKRKYFVLGGNYLRRYASPESIENGDPYKEIVLCGSSTVTHTDIETCFVVKSPQLDPTLGEEQISWILKTDTPEDAKEWIVHISSHIHFIYLQTQPNIPVESLNQAGSSNQLSFWTLPHHNSAGPVTNPVGIRSLPDQNGPRTGEGIYPGEIFEVTQQIHSFGSDGRGLTCLRLAGDRGWVFDKHPTGGYDLIVPLEEAAYCYQERNMNLQVEKQLRSPIPIQFNPSSTSPATKYQLKAGEDCLACATFALVSNSAAASSSEDVLQGVDFVKLRDGRGWVATKTSSDQQVFVPVARKRGDSGTAAANSSESRVRGSSMYRKKVLL